MHRRKPFSSGAVAATIATIAMLGGCREATTGPAGGEPSAFAAAVKPIQGNAQSGPEGSTLPQQLIVKVVDAGGVPVPGATVTFAARTGGGSIVPPSVSTGTDGTATAAWTLGAALGSQTAVALLNSNFVTDSASFSATATTGPGSGFVVVSGNSQTGVVGKPFALPLVVKVTDSFGNNVSGAPVTWTPAALSGTVTPSKDSTGADGTASVTWTAGNTAGTQTVSASISGLPPIIFTAVVGADTSNIQITIVSGAVDTAAVSAKPSSNLSVRVIDQFGNPVVGDVVTWNAAISGGGTVSSPTSKTDATGTATTAWTLGARAGAQSLTASEANKSLIANFSAVATVSFSDVFAGNFMACGIAASNNATYCWGVGDGGQLGRGSLANTNVPTWPVTQTDTTTGYIQIRQLSGGNDGFCALTIDRRLYCWGRTIGVSLVTSPVAAAEPIVTGSSSQQILPSSIAMGEQHVCLLDLTGLAFCTGSDLHGELGDSAGGTNPGTSPSVGTYPFVADAPPGGWAKIAAGQAHTCAMPRFNPNDASSQRPRCWGLNTSGQVGNDKTSGNGGQQIPALVTMPAGVTAFDSSTITAGAQHSCAIVAGTGAAYCWGANGSNQLGTGQATTVLDSVPTLVVSTATFSKIYAGTYHTCAITTDGSTAYCWGRNDYGQLGIGAGAGQAVPTTPVPLTVGGGNVIRSISLGEFYTCAVVGPPVIPGSPSQSGGTIYCWGDNLFGQIGNGTTGNNNPVFTPTKVKFQP